MVRSGCGGYILADGRWWWTVGGGWRYNLVWPYLDLGFDLNTDTYEVNRKPTEAATRGVLSKMVLLRIT